MAEEGILGFVDRLWCGGKDLGLEVTQMWTRVLAASSTGQVNLYVALSLSEPFFNFLQLWNEIHHSF